MLLRTVVTIYISIRAMASMAMLNNQRVVKNKQNKKSPAYFCVQTGTESKDFDKYRAQQAELDPPIDVGTITDLWRR